MLENRGIDFHHVKKYNVPKSTVSIFNKYVRCLRHTVYQDSISIMNKTVLQKNCPHYVTCILYNMHKTFIVWKNSQIHFMEYYFDIVPRWWSLV